MKIKDGQHNGSTIYNYWIHSSITDGNIIQNTNNNLLTKKNNKIKKK
jgi:hypothetical protein